MLSAQVRSSIPGGQECPRSCPTLLIAPVCRLALDTLRRFSKIAGMCGLVRRQACFETECETPDSPLAFARGRTERSSVPLLA